MARLVIGTSKTKTVPAVVRDISTAPDMYLAYNLSSAGVLSKGSAHIVFEQIKDISAECLKTAFEGDTSLSGVINLGNLEGISGNSGFESTFKGCINITGVNLSSLTSVTGSYGAANMFDGCAGITGALDLSSLTTVGNYGCYQMFVYCNGITSADCSGLETVNGTSVLHGLFGYCNGITSADFSNLKSVSGNNAINAVFYECSNLVSVDLSSLTFIGSGTYPLGTLFYGCPSLQNVRFDSLAVINGSNTFQQAFQGATSLTTLSFPSLSSRGNTGIFYSMLSGVRGCTIHFPKNLDPQTGSTVISGLSTYPNFGGTNTVLAFDLPSTLTLTGADTVTYTRNPKYDTATALAWKVGAYGTTNFTPAYYTSGTADPQANDTIYSDAACTTSVTTVSAIA